MDRTKARYFAVAVFLSAFCLFTGGTYSYFALSKFLSAATISIAKLNYELTSTDTNFQNNSITVEAGKTVKLTLDLKSLNAQNTKYALDYISDNPNLKVYYVGNMEQNVQGEIGGLNSIINIKIVIKNTGRSNGAVQFDLKGGYLQNTLESNINEAQPSSPLMAVDNSKLWAHKSYIKKVVFETKISPKENYAYSYDISQDGDESVMTYLVQNSEDSTYIAYIQSNGKTIANKNSKYLFQDFISLESIEGLENLNTSDVTDMSYMFNNCNKLVSLNVGDFDTSKVTDMSYMFNNCSKLTSLNVGSFDTSNVTYISYMFNKCSSLATLDVSNFDTSKVTNMSGMFNDCSKLSLLNVGGFNTGNVTNMNGMFNGCSSLTTLDVSGFDTSKVIDMSSMFSNCSGLMTLYVGNFDTSKVTDMCSMFYNCSGLTTIKLNNFDTRNVNDMSAMFAKCNNLKTLDLSSFDTSNVFYMGKTTGMFEDCSSLTTLDLSNFDTSNVINMGNMFKGCSSLTLLNISSFDTGNVNNMSAMFKDCSSLETLDVSVLNTSKVTDMSWMFDGCSSLTTLDVSDFDTRMVKNMRYMFDDCSNLITLDLSNFDMNRVTNVSGIFAGCKKLSTTITIISTRCTEYDYMFSSAATTAGSQITVNYTSKTSALVDKMIATKLNSSNVVKASQPEQEYTITLSDTTDVQLSSTQEYRLKVITLTPNDEGKVVTSFKMNGELINGNSFKMPGANVTISDVVLADAFIAESEHRPYSGSLDNKEYFNKTFEGAKSITVFLEYQTESIQKDYVYLYDKDDKQYGRYGGSTIMTEVITIPGDTLRITFSTNSTDSYYYGFKAMVVPNY